MHECISIRTTCFVTSRSLNADSFLKIGCYCVHTLFFFRITWTVPANVFTLKCTLWMLLALSLFVVFPFGHFPPGFVDSLWCLEESFNLRTKKKSGAIFFKLLIIRIIKMWLCDSINYYSLAGGHAELVWVIKTSRCIRVCQPKPRPDRKLMEIG